MGRAETVSYASKITVDDYELGGGTANSKKCSICDL